MRRGSGLFPKNLKFKINLKNMLMKKFNNYHYIILTVISNTEEFITHYLCYKLLFFTILALKIEKNINLAPPIL
jgi:hypothetical protein